jgi:hypothetical protein
MDKMKNWDGVVEYNATDNALLISVNNEPT